MPEVVAGVAELRSGQQQDALGLDEARRPVVDPERPARSAAGSRRSRRVAGPIRSGRPSPRRSRPAGRGRPRRSRATGRGPVARAEPDQREDLRRRRRADGGVVLQGGAAGQELAVPRRQPADAQAGHRERLRHHAQRDPPLEGLGARGQPVRLVELEASGRPRRPGGGCRRPRRRGRAPPHSPGRRQHPGRVVRGVDDDEPGRRGELAPQAVDVERPAVRPRAARGGSRPRRPPGRPRTGSGSPARSTTTWSPGPASTFMRQKIASSAPANTRTSSASSPRRGPRSRDGAAGARSIRCSRG